jgi:hypothetical protein
MDDTNLHPYRNRVRIESAELEEKLERLRVFMHTAQFTALTRIERERLTRQETAMASYAAVLRERILAF